MEKVIEIIDERLKKLELEIDNSLTEDNTFKLCLEVRINELLKLKIKFIEEGLI